MAVTPPPAGLGRKGAAFWRKIQKDFDLAVHEEMLLEQACMVADQMDRLNKFAKTAPQTVKGSTGQDIMNPVYGEIRQHNASMMSLVKALKLPEATDDRPQSPKSAHGQAAANARWARGA